MTAFRWAFVAAVVVKAVDATILNGSVVGFAWFLAGALLVSHERVGGGLVALLGIGGASALGQPSMGSHAILIGSVGLFLALFDDDRSRWRMLRLQVVTVYVFAGLSKVVSGFLSGALIAGRQPWLPAPQALAVAAVAIELWLGVATWRRWRSALPVAALLHGGIVVLWTIDLTQLLELAAFNGLTLAMAVLAITTPPPDEPGTGGQGVGSEAVRPARSQPAASIPVTSAR